MIVYYTFACAVLFFSLGLAVGLGLTHRGKWMGTIRAVSHHHVYVAPPDRVRFDPYLAQRVKQQTPAAESA